MENGSKSRKILKSSTSEAQSDNLHVFSSDRSLGFANVSPSVRLSVCKHLFEDDLCIFISSCFYIFKSLHLLIFKSSHLLIFIFSSSHLHIFIFSSSSSHLHLLIFIFSSSSSHLQILASSHLHHS